jgi:hypothetical protein
MVKGKKKTATELSKEPTFVKTEEPVKCCSQNSNTQTLGAALWVVGSLALMWMIIKPYDFVGYVAWVLVTIGAWYNGKNSK